jgi:hypothetical protein
MQCGLYPQNWQSNDSMRDIATAFLFIQSDEENEILSLVHTGHIAWIWVAWNDFVNVICV